MKNWKSITSVKKGKIKIINKDYQITEYDVFDNNLEKLKLLNNFDGSVKHQKQLIRAC